MNNKLITISRLKIISFFPILLIFVSIFIFCSDDISSNSDSYVYNIPVQNDDGWETASLSGVGINEGRFIMLMNFLNQQSNHYIHGILIAKEGKLVFEEYFRGDDMDKWGSLPAGKPSLFPGVA